MPNTNPLYLASFDDTTTPSEIFDSASGAAISSSYGRNGTQGLHLGNGGDVKKNVPVISSFYCGFALYVESASSNLSNLFLVRDSIGSADQLKMGIDTGGHLSFYRGTTLLGTSTLSISFGAWHYIEIHGVIDNTVGVAEVIVDGLVTFLSLSGVDTQASSNASFGEFHLAGSAQVLIRIDDLYFLDAAGSSPNGYIGDSVVGWYQPNGAGSNADWTPSSGSNYQNVDEEPPDDDTTYNESAAIGNVDTFAHPGLPSDVQNIVAVMLKARIRNTSGAPVIHLAILSGATLGESGDIAVPAAYTSVLAPFPNDPGSGAAWTQTGFNNAEIGYKQTA